MLPLRGMGGLQGSRAFSSSDLMLPLPSREVGEQWVFGRTDRFDLSAVADEVAAQGTRYAAAGRQAALETLFAGFISGAHSAALDDAQVVLPEEVLVDDPECLALQIITRDKIERLRFPDVPGFEAEMRAWIRDSVTTILAGPVLQWRPLLSAKFQEVAELAHETALQDVLRDVPAEHPTCQPLVNLSRFQIAQEQFS